MTIAQDSARCPSWCETSDHEQGERTHQALAHITCSMHPMPPDMAQEQSSQNRWDLMDVRLVAPPTLSEPFMEICGHYNDMTGLAAEPFATRLTLAEAWKLADVLQDLLMKAATRGAHSPARPDVIIPAEGRDEFAEKHITRCPVQRVFTAG